MMHLMLLGLFVGVMPQGALVAQQQTVEGLADLYQSIITGFDNGHPPAMVEVTDYLNKVPTMNVNEIRAGLPWIEKAIESPRVEVRHYGGLALFAINQRPDSRSLIEYLVPVLANNLTSPSVNTRIWAIRALSEMKPQPPDNAVSALLRDLPAERELAPGIVFALVQINPDREDIAAGIAKYMASQMSTPREKIDTLNAMATRPVHDKRLIALIAKNLTAQPEDVELSAIHALERSGQTAVETARPQLQRLAESSEASERMRAAAQHALGASGAP